MPNQEICIDESMIGMKNRCAFIMYMANKRHARFGIKKFELCDSATGYVMLSALYSGRDFLEIGADPFTRKVVDNLMTNAGLYRKYYHLFTDNFYTKIPLANFLMQHKTFLTGTIRKTSRFLSDIVQRAMVAVGVPLYFRKSKVLLVKYKERATHKPVMLISTAFHAEDRRVRSRANVEKIKPVVINGYNQHMGGVDCKDKSIFHLTCSRQTKRYWKKIVYNFVDMALLNAYILYRFHSNRPMSRWDFMLEIVSSLLPGAAPVLDPPGDAPRPQPPPAQPAHLGHKLERLPGKYLRLCLVCKKKTNFW